MNIEKLTETKWCHYAAGTDTDIEATPDGLQFGFDGTITWSEIDRARALACAPRVGVGSAFNQLAKQIHCHCRKHFRIAARGREDELAPWSCGPSCKP